jgi:hypothetical protein
MTWFAVGIRAGLLLQRARLSSGTGMRLAKHTPSGAHHLVEVLDPLVDEPLKAPAN